MVHPLAKLSVSEHGVPLSGRHKSAVQAAVGNPGATRDGAVRPTVLRLVPVSVAGCATRSETGSKSGPACEWRGACRRRDPGAPGRHSGRGWTTIENGVAADCEPRLSVETRLNENVPAVVGVPAMRVPLLKRWMLVPGGNEPWTTR